MIKGENNSSNEHIVICFLDFIFCLRYLLLQCAIGTRFSYKLDALPVTQSTVSKHWRNYCYNYNQHYYYY